jgi:hypothetical protein
MLTCACFAQDIAEVGVVQSPLWHVLVLVYRLGEGSVLTWQT